MLEHALAAGGLLAIFVVLLLKETGIPVPVPSDLIVITAGIQAASRVYPLTGLLLATVAAVFLGGTAQYLLTRTAGRRLIARFGRYVGLSPARLDRAGALLEQRGMLAIFLGLNIPGARAGVIPAAGLAGVPYRIFAPAMLAGSSCFFGWHIALGYFIGPAALALLARIHVPLIPVILALAVLGLAIWLVMRRRGQLRAGDLDDVAARARAWSEAACPACLALSAVQRLRPQPAVGTPQEPKQAV